MARRVTKASASGRVVAMSLSSSLLRAARAALDFLSLSAAGVVVVVGVDDDEAESTSIEVADEAASGAGAVLGAGGLPSASMRAALRSEPVQRGLRQRCEVAGEEGSADPGSRRARCG